MEGSVQNYLQAKQGLFSHFGCNEQYFVRDLLDLKWTIKMDADTYILTYWEKANKPTYAIIIKKDGKPCVYRSDKHTMIIGIDCVKIAFLLSNEHEG